jgi:predicted signal transduction protein with EAL and GGDEF domain
MILSALINIGKNLKHRVVAEGVETEEQLHFLQQEGCGEGQGYFFCRPIIAEKFAEFLERGVIASTVDYPFEHGGRVNRHPKLAGNLAPQQLQIP